MSKTFHYSILPVIDGEASNFPLLPVPAGIDQALSALKSRIELMERQGYWRDDRGQQVPLELVQYLISPAPIEEGEDEDPPAFGEPASEEFEPRDHNDADGIQTMQGQG